MPNFKKNPTPFMMKGKSPMMKALIGKQKNLPDHLKAAILAAPTKMYGGKSAMKGYKSDAQRKAVHASKAERSGMKNYKKGYYGA